MINNGDFHGNVLKTARHDFTSHDFLGMGSLYHLGDKKNSRGIGFSHVWSSVGDWGPKGAPKDLVKTFWGSKNTLGIFLDYNE